MLVVAVKGAAAEGGVELRWWWRWRWRKPAAAELVPSFVPQDLEGLVVALHCPGCCCSFRCCWRRQWGRKVWGQREGAAATVQGLAAVMAAATAAALFALIGFAGEAAATALVRVRGLPWCRGAAHHGGLPRRHPCLRGRDEAVLLQLLVVLGEAPAAAAPWQGAGAKEQRSTAQCSEGEEGRGGLHVCVCEWSCRGRLASFPYLGSQRVKGR